MLFKIRRMIALLLLITVTSTFMSSLSIFAANEEHWAQNVLERWQMQGLLKGDEENNLNPNQAISRAEFVTLVNRIKGFSGSTNLIEHYSDVQKSDWFYQNMAIALANKYLKGTSLTTLSPNQPILRQEAMMMVARLEDLSDNSATLTQVKDRSSISDWANLAVAQCINEGYITGYNGAIRPLDTISRAEAVVLLDRISRNHRVFNFAGKYGGTAADVEDFTSVSILAPDITLNYINVENDFMINDIANGSLTLHACQVNTVDVVSDIENYQIIADAASKIKKVTISTSIANNITLQIPNTTIVNASQIASVYDSDGNLLANPGETIKTDLYGKRLDNKIFVKKIVTKQKSRDDNDDEEISTEMTVEEETSSQTEEITEPTTVEEETSTEVEDIAESTTADEDNTTAVEDPTEATTAEQETPTRNDYNPYPIVTETRTNSNPIPENPKDEIDSEIDDNENPSPPDNLIDDIIDLGDLEVLIAEEKIELARNDYGDVVAIDGQFTDRLVTDNQSAAELLNAASSLFGENFNATPGAISVNVIDEGKDSEQSFYRYQPTYRNLPVIGGQIIIPTDNTGKVIGLFSSYSDKITRVDTEADISPSVATKAAIEVLLKDQAVKGYISQLAVKTNSTTDSAIDIFTDALDIEVVKLINASELSDISLNYFVLVEYGDTTDLEIYDDANEPIALPMFDDQYFIAANGPRAGDVILVNTSIREIEEKLIDSTGVERTIVTHDKKLIDNSRRISTGYDIFGIFKVEKYVFAWNKKAITGHANLSEVYDYFKNILHYDLTAESGHYTLSVGLEEFNASNNTRDNKIRFNNRLLSSMDVFGHEFTHGVIANVVGQIKTDKIYSGLFCNPESEALNEAYADIMGLLFEDKLGDDRWKIAEDSDHIIRNLQSDSFEITENNQTKTIQKHYNFYNKEYDCHLNSNIFSHGVYKIMTDHRTKDISSEEWAKLFYKSMYLMTSSFDFISARHAIVFTAKQQGFTQDQIDAIKKGFDDVGIKVPPSIRIVLTWGEQPRDLDSHLIGPAVSGNEKFHIYYGQKNYFQDGSYYSDKSLCAADLNYDDTTSYGPEITTISKLTPGEYRFYVHDYSNQSSYNSNALYKSKAKVAFYSNQQSLPLKTFSVGIDSPLNIPDQLNLFPPKKGTLWQVFKITIEENGRYSIEEINQLTFATNSSRVGQD